MLLLQHGGDRRQVLAGLLRRPARLQAADAAKGERGPVSKPVALRRRQHRVRHHRRNPHIRTEDGVHALEALWCHADDGEGQPVDPNRAADNVGRGAKPCQPRGMREDEDRTGARRHILVRPEEAAQARHDGERVEVVAGHDLAEETLRRIAAGEPENHRRRVASEVLEHHVPGADVLEIETGDREGFARGRALHRGSNRDELVRACDRQRIQEQCVDHREHRRVGGNAERDREDDDRGEARRGAELPRGESQVLPECLHRRSSGAAGRDDHRSVAKTTTAATSAYAAEAANTTAFWRLSLQLTRDASQARTGSARMPCINTA